MPSHQPAAGYSAKDPQYLSSGKTAGTMAKSSEPNRSKSYDPKKPHITDSPITKKNWYKHVNWLNVYLIVIIPLGGCIAAFWTPLDLNTALFAVAYYFATGLGITAGKYVDLRLINPHPHYVRLSSSLGTHILFGHASSPYLPCRCRRRRCRRVSPMVGSGP